MRNISSEVLELVPALKVPAMEVMKFRKLFLDNNEHSINGSRGLHNYNEYGYWVNLVKKCAKPQNELLGVKASPFFAKRMSDGKYIGCIELRHELSESLKTVGGHVGYSVIPDERRKGYAQMMLRMICDYAYHLKIKALLLTCDVQNEASIKTILRCGGVKENSTPIDYEGELINRYWIYLPVQQ